DRLTQAAHAQALDGSMDTLGPRGGLEIAAEVVAGAVEGNLRPVPFHTVALTHLPGCRRQDCFRGVHLARTLARRAAHRATFEDLTNFEQIQNLAQVEFGD